MHTNWQKDGWTLSSALSTCLAKYLQSINSLVYNNISNKTQYTCYYLCGRVIAMYLSIPRRSMWRVLFRKKACCNNVWYLHSSYCARYSCTRSSWMGTRASDKQDPISTTDRPLIITYIFDAQFFAFMKESKKREFPDKPNKISKLSIT